MWVLAAVFIIGQYEIITRPIYIYDVEEYCEIDKATLQPYTSILLTCTTLEREV